MPQVLHGSSGISLRPKDKYEYGHTDTQERRACTSSAARTRHPHEVTAVVAELAAI